MKKLIPYLILLLGLIIVAAGLRPQKNAHGFDLSGFAALPAQSNGRLQPLDSVAQNALRILSGRTSFSVKEVAEPIVLDSYGNPVETTRRVSAAEWLADMTFRPELANTYPVFRIDNDQVLALFGWRQGSRKYFSWNELAPHFATLQEQTKTIPPERDRQNVEQRAIAKLASSLMLYNQMAHLLNPGGGLDELVLEYASWAASVGPGRDAFAAMERQQEYNREDFERFAFYTDRYMRLSSVAAARIAPPSELPHAHAASPNLNPTGTGNDYLNDWLNIGEALLGTIQTSAVSPTALNYAKMTQAYRASEPAAFNQAVAALHGTLDREAPMGKLAFERFFNAFQPFYQSSVLYVLIFVIVCVSWLVCAQPLQKGAWYLLLLAFAIHTFGLLARMYIQDRPPVTNLYSSAVFVGWGAVLLGIILERVYKGGMGSFVSALIGFCTLVIAHNLGAGGDTLEMMQAVLDSNFWLATHVVVITAGYSAVFLAGALGIVYVFKGTLGTTLTREQAGNLYRMAYGITCFGLLFSFVGTMLGGIWADQSWGRFWGWDPKENGALLIVLWGALMLHARWAGIARERGFMLLAIFGNVITAWSWFGTNMLGIGLHSYGFMDKAVFWLEMFWLSQVLIILLGSLPLRVWRSRIQPLPDKA